jgi:hypothetical protein
MDVGSLRIVRQYLILLDHNPRCPGLLGVKRSVRSQSGVLISGQSTCYLRISVSECLVRKIANPGTQTHSTPIFWAYSMSASCGFGFLSHWLLLTLKHQVMPNGADRPLCRGFCRMLPRHGMNRLCPRSQADARRDRFMALSHRAGCDVSSAVALCGLGLFECWKYHAPR